SSDVCSADLAIHLRAYDVLRELHAVRELAAPVTRRRRQRLNTPVSVRAPDTVRHGVDGTLQVQDALTRRRDVRLRRLRGGRLRRLRGGRLRRLRRWLL